MDIYRRLMENFAVAVRIQKCLIDVFLVQAVTILERDYMLAKACGHLSQGNFDGGQIDHCSVALISFFVAGGDASECQSQWHLQSGWFRAETARHFRSRFSRPRDQSDRSPAIPFAKPPEMPREFGPPKGSLSLFRISGLSGARGSLWRTRLTRNLRANSLLGKIAGRVEPQIRVHVMRFSPDLSAFYALKGHQNEQGTGAAVAGKFSGRSREISCDPE